MPSEIIIQDTGSDSIPPEVRINAYRLLLHGDRAAAARLIVERSNHSVAEAEEKLDKWASRAELAIARRPAGTTQIIVFVIGVTVFIAGLIRGASFSNSSFAVVASILGAWMWGLTVRRVLFSIRHRGWKQTTVKVERGAFVSRLNATSDLYRVWVEYDSRMKGWQTDALAQVPAGGQPVDWSRAVATVHYNPKDRIDPIVIQQVKLR